MDHRINEELRRLTGSTAGDLSRLILKLRWIGLDHDAERLQSIARKMPVEDRGTVSSGPINTD